MHEEPRNKSFFTPAAYDAQMTLRRDGKIVGQEVNRVGVVESNSADLGGRHDYGVGFRRTNPLLGLLLAREVERRVIGCKNLACFKFEPAHDSAADHAVVARDVDTLGLEVEQRHIAVELQS